MTKPDDISRAEDGGEISAAYNWDFLNASARVPFKRNVLGGCGNIYKGGRRHRRTPTDSN